MTAQTQYLTNERGERVGVVLDMDTYQHLLTTASTDPEILSNLSQEELEALAATQLAHTAQTKLDALLTHQNEGVLTTEEQETLDTLLSQVDQLTILKTRARYTLHKSTQQIQ